MGAAAAARECIPARHRPRRESAGPRREPLATDVVPSPRLGPVRRAHPLL